MRSLLLETGVVEDSVCVSQLADATFEVCNAEGDSLFVAKLISTVSAQEHWGIHGAHREAHRLGTLVQPVRWILQIDQGGIAILDWVDGVSLKEANREMLPRLFSALRDWHESNRDLGSIFSPYTKDSYSCIAEFVEAETEIHCRNAGLTEIQSRAIDRLQGLDYGFVTLLHGDVHPGNILVNEDRLTLLDPEHVHCNVNLLDLDYVDLWESPTAEAPWWSIAKYASACVDEYFKGCGLPADQIQAAMQSVRLLTALRAVTNSLHYETGQTAGAIANLDAILAS